MNFRLGWLMYLLGAIFQFYPGTRSLEEKKQEDPALFQDVISLSELPLDRLLRIKKDIVRVPEERESEDEVSAEEVDRPRAEKLVGLATSKDEQVMQMSPMRGSNNFRRGYGHGGGGGHGDEMDNQKASLSSVFQMSVTFLSFIAFAGYLCCLILQAIREKKQQQQTMMVVVPATPPMARVETVQNFQRTVPDGNRKRKKRKKREQRSGENVQDTDFPLIVPSMDEFYHLVTLFVEGYTKYERSEPNG